MPCLIKPDMHHTWLCIMPWLCGGCLLCCVLLFRCLLLRVGSGNVVLVRNHSSTSVCLLHGLVLLPCGISGKMTIPSKSLLSLLASCSIYCYSRYLPLAISCLPYCHVKPLTHLSQQTVVWLCYRFCSAPLIALLGAGEDEDCSMLDYVYVGISQYLLS